MDNEQEPLSAEQVIDKRIEAILSDIEHDGSRRDWTVDHDERLRRWVELKAQAERDRNARVDNGVLVAN